MEAQYPIPNSRPLALPRGSVEARRGLAGTTFELRLPPALRRAVENHVRRGYPHEVCGLLIGRSTDGVNDVRAVHPARNLNVTRAHDRYQLDPSDQFAAEESARAAGLTVVGVYHSHPDHQAWPSETDRDAAWGGWSYLIVSVDAREVLDLRSFRLIDGFFQPESLTHESLP